MGRQLGGQENGCGAISAADDADGGGFQTGEEAGCAGSEECHENAKLGGSTQEHALGVTEQRTEIGHGTYAHENQAGIQTGFDTDVENIQQTAVSSTLAGKSHGRRSLVGCSPWSR